MASSDDNENNSQVALAVPRYATLRKDDVLKKHVAVVHTSGELGLLERKLVNVLLLNAYDQLAAGGVHKIPTKILMLMLGWEGGEDTVHLQKALKKVMTTYVEFNLMDDNIRKKKWSGMTLLSHATLENGYCLYGYAEPLAEELANPEIYALINVGIQTQFKSGYALTLYENAVRYRRTGSTGMIALDTLRKLLGATASTYDDYRRLYELVLKKAIKEVNTVSDITVTPEFERSGRKVTRIKFNIEEKVQQSLLAHTPNAIEQAKQSDTYKRLRTHGIGPKLAAAWVVTDEPRAKTALDITEQRARNKQIKANTGGYVRRLIEDDTIDLAKNQFEVQLSEEDRAREIETAKTAASQAQIEQKQRDKDVLVKAWMKALPQDQLIALSNVYVGTEAGAKLSKSYDPATGTFANAMERVPFNSWLRTQYNPTAVGNAQKGD